MKNLAKLASLAAVAALSASAVYAARPDTRTMSCEQVHRLIVRNGAIVLTTGQHTYDRFVSHGGYCDHPNVPMSVYVPTTDTRGCRVYNCQRTPYDDFW